MRQHSVSICQFHKWRRQPRSKWEDRGIAWPVAVLIFSMREVLRSPSGPKQALAKVMVKTLSSRSKILRKLMGQRQLMRLNCMFDMEARRGVRRSQAEPVRTSQ